MTRKLLTFLTACIATCFVSFADTPTWLEADSAAAIASRTRADFPYTVDEFYQLARQKYETLTRKQLEEYIANNYVETLQFDTLRVFRKALRNLPLLLPTSGDQRPPRGSQASAKSISYVDSILAGDLTGHRVTARFTLDVPYDEAIAGDTLRVWLPFPMQSQRQENIRLLYANTDNYVLSGDKSIHSSIYFTAPSPKLGETAHFEYIVSFDTFGEYFSPQYIEENMQPYDKSSEVYQQYTAFEAPHIVNMEGLARQIVGNETNPFKQSELVYDYIIKNYPWAGAREYSTIGCIPTYVIEQRHGDCGQVSLLYISLMRSLGVPARWESGWELHPGDLNLHDWAEVFFEGIGWVPVDVSFGRFTPSDNPEVVTFYSHGIDAHRFVANKGVCGEFYPPKRFVRSETVDAQVGEVEISKGNLFYPAWSSHFEVLRSEPIRRGLTVAADADIPFNMIETYGNPDVLVSIPVASIRVKPAHSAEMSTQAVMGTPLRSLDEEGEWMHILCPDGYEGYVPKSSVKRLTPEAMSVWQKDANRAVVTCNLAYLYTESTTTDSRKVVSPLIFNSIVTVDYEKIENGRIFVTLPDGRSGWADFGIFSPIEQWANQPFDAQKVLDISYSLEGTSYLWGGTTVMGIDCSGMVKTAYLGIGYILRRDASQQAKTGLRLSDQYADYQAGDLLFFGKNRVTHVGIYDSEAMYVHCSGRVKRNSLDPAAASYLYSPLFAVRIAGKEGSDGIVRVVNHPWFFVK